MLLLLLLLLLLRVHLAAELVALLAGGEAFPLRGRRPSHLLLVLLLLQVQLLLREAATATVWLRCLDIPC